MTVTTFSYTAEEAHQLDAADPLANFVDRFYRRENIQYMDGNSLGLLSKDAEAATIEALEQWKHYAVDGWGHPDTDWLHMPERLGAMTAELIGAKPEECVVTGQTTVNLHALLATFYPREGRPRLLADTANFPSDLYALANHVTLHSANPDGLSLISPRSDGWIYEEDVMERLSEDVSLLLLPSVWYQSGQLASIPRLTEAAHAKGILVCFDLAHSIGVVPHHLHEDGVDLAVWCNYKYLNGGPGTIGGLFVHERHHGTAPLLSGWFGSDKARQFEMSIPMVPAHSASAWQISTPSIIAAAAVQAGLSLTLEAGLSQLRAKSLQLTDYLMTLLDEKIIRTTGEGQLGTPRQPSRRGGHVAFYHPEAAALSRALRANQVIPDYRPPNTLRFAPVPMYTRFIDVWKTVDTLYRLLSTRAYESFRDSNDLVS